MQEGFVLPENLEDLVDFRVSREKRDTLHRHFGKDAADRPHVDGCGIMPGAQQYLWRAIPESDDLENK